MQLVGNLPKVTYNWYWGKTAFEHKWFGSLVPHLTLTPWIHPDRGRKSWVSSTHPAEDTPSVTKGMWLEEKGHTG